MRWTIWFAITMSILIYQVTLGGGILHGRDAVSLGFGFPIPLVLGFAGAAGIIRWIVVPRFEESRSVLTLLIVGLSLSESLEFFGIFLVPREMPATKMEIFVLSFLSALQFMPFSGTTRAETSQPDAG